MRFVCIKIFGHDYFKKDISYKDLVYVRVRVRVYIYIYTHKIPVPNAICGASALSR